MFFGVVIITGVYPDSRAHGPSREKCHPMALTVMLALTGALLLTLTLIRCSVPSC